MNRKLRKVPIRAELVNGQVVFYVPLRLIVEGQRLPQEFFLDALTPQEVRIFELLIKGKQNKEIAQELQLSVRTTKFHVSSLLAKTGCVSRYELVNRYNQR